MDLQSDPKMKSDIDKSRAERVPVRLQVVIGDYVAKSVNISETGVLINNYEGPELSEGDTVRVLIEGIISDDDSGYELAYMYVVRIQGTQLALSFSEVPAAE